MSERKQYEKEAGLNHNYYDSQQYSIANWKYVEYLESKLSKEQGLRKDAEEAVRVAVDDYNEFKDKVREWVDANNSSIEGFFEGGLSDLKQILEGK